MDPVVVVDLQLGGIDITYPGHFSQASAVDEAEQGHADPLPDLNETVVGYCLGEIAFLFPQDAVFVVVLKAFVSAQMVVNADCHYLGRAKCPFHGGEFF